MPPSSPADRSDADTVRHDTGNTTPDIQTPEPRSTEQTHELAHYAVLGTHCQPPKTQFKRDDIAGAILESIPSQRAKSDADGLDDCHRFPEKEAVLREDFSTSWSSEINDLSRALESRLSLSERPTKTEALRRASKRRLKDEKFNNMTTCGGLIRNPVRCSHYSLTEIMRSGSASANFGQAHEDNNLVQCFVDGCENTKPFISFLL